MLRRYWFEFDFSRPDARIFDCQPECGVTAYDYEDAINLMKESVFADSDLPPIRTVVEDIDISKLDGRHVRPNMGIPVFRGVWFPKELSKSGQVPADQ